MQSEQAGFTLIEVLVALVATGLMLGIIMNGALLARERQVGAAETRDAVLLARQLVTARSVHAYARGDEEGREGRLGWRLSEQPLVTDPRGLWVLTRIRVAITGSNGATLFSGETRKLKRAMP